VAEPAFGTVSNDGAEGTVRIRRQLHGAPDGEPSLQRRLRGPEPLRGAGEDRPGGRDPVLPFGQESIRIAESPKDGAEVGSTDPHVVEDEHGRSTLPTQAAKEPGDDLDHGEAAAVKPPVQVP